jgi:hypothetical protein
MCASLASFGIFHVIYSTIKGRCVVVDGHVVRMQRERFEFELTNLIWYSASVAK